VRFLSGQRAGCSDMGEEMAAGRPRILIPSANCAPFVALSNPFCALRGDGVLGRVGILAGPINACQMRAS